VIKRGGEIMKGMKTLLVLLLILLVGPVPSPSAERIRVVACTLDMADFAKQIGGDLIEVYSITKGKTDLHFYEPRPSQVVKLHRADLLVVGGLDIDIWMQPLIDAARNPRIQFGASGYVDPSRGVLALDVPQGRIDGSMGDVHPWGNPHFWFTPKNVRIAIENIYDGLCRVSPENRDVFKTNKESYLAKVDRAFEELQDKMAPFRETKVV
jgi:zinc/manganese transport system substrate-binding protein